VHILDDDGLIQAKLMANPGFLLWSEYSKCAHRHQANDIARYGVENREDQDGHAKHDGDRGDQPADDVGDHVSARTSAQRRSSSDVRIAASTRCAANPSSKLGGEALPVRMSRTKLVSRRWL